MPAKTRELEARKAQTASAANGAVAPAIAAPTADNDFAYLLGFYAELVSVLAPAAGTVALSVTGLENTLTFTLNRTAVAAVVNDSILIMFPKPMRASAAKTAISVSGNSGDANTTLRIHLFGYTALGK